VRGLQGRLGVLQNGPFHNTPHSRVICQKRTNDSNPNSKQSRIKMLRGFLCVFRIETVCKWLRLTPKKHANQSASNNCQICKCSFSTKLGTGKLGRISTENLSQTSNREGSRATTLALMCSSIAIVI
jgi:hypothetical protein